MNKTTYFVDHLNLLIWFQSVWPVLFRNRLAKRTVFPRCYFVDGSRSSELIARITAGLLGMKLDKLAFKLTEVIEEDGTQSHLLVTYQGLNEARKEVTGGDFLKGIKDNHQLPGRLADFLGKSAVKGEPGDRGTVGHAQYMAHVCSWKNRLEGTPSQDIVLFQEGFPWFDQARNYAAAKGVTLVPVRPPFAVKSALRKRVPLWLKRFLQGLKRGRNSAGEGQQIVPGVGGGSDSLSPGSRVFSKSSPGPRLLVESTGILNINRPELHSDVFFWQNSALSGSDLLLTFALPQVPLDQRQWQELDEHHMSALILHPRASTIPSSDAPYFNPPNRSRQAQHPSVQTRGYRAEKR